VSQPDFQTMTRNELRAYVLAHREDEVAFQVYVGLLTALPSKAFKFEDTAALHEHLALRVAQEQQARQ